MGARRCSIALGPTAPSTRSGTLWRRCSARTASPCSSDPMTALPAAPSIDAVRDVIRRLQALAPGAYRVVSCYLKLEPRDKTRGKYLIKMKDRKSTRLNSSHGYISYAVFCLKKKKRYLAHTRRAHTQSP